MFADQALLVRVKSLFANSKAQMLPFSAFREKDTNCILAFVKSISDKLDILITEEQTTTIRNYIDYYFSLQPSFTNLNLKGLK